MLAGKDKIVDNQGARDFYAKCKTPNDKKSIKLFYQSYHQIHKEPQYKTQLYKATYEFITKTIQTSNKNDLIWKELKSFEVGRTNT